MMRNSLVLAGLGAVLALGLVEYGCSSSSGGGGSGGSTTGQGGKGQGGSTTGQGGSTTGAGGSTTTGTGGSTTAGTGGSTTTGSGGATGSDGGVTMCVAPVPADKGGCQGTESPCTKNCGPNVIDLNMGRPQKACACTGAAVTGFPMSWDCATAGPCTWPPALAAVACFHLPATVPACPTESVDGGAPGLLRPNMSPCTVGAGATCDQTCGSATANSYQDSTGAGKMGYCVCVARANGTARWQCASIPEWAPQ